MNDIEHLYKKPKERVPLTPDQLNNLDIPSIDDVNEANDLDIEDESDDE